VSNEDAAPEWQPDTREPAARAAAKAEGIHGASLPQTFDTRTERGEAFVPEDNPPLARKGEGMELQPYHQRVKLDDLERLGFDRPDTNERRPSIDRRAR
jgi:hypothetical protein